MFPHKRCPSSNIRTCVFNFSYFFSSHTAFIKKHPPQTLLPNDFTIEALKINDSHTIIRHHITNNGLHIIQGVRSPQVEACRT